MRFNVNLLVIATWCLTVTHAASVNHELHSPLYSQRSGRIPNAFRYVVYWSVWADLAEIPTADQLDGVTHLVLGFANITTFGTGAYEFVPAYAGGSSFTAATLATLRQIKPDMKVMASFGGWNLDQPYRGNASTDDTSPGATSGRTWFAKQIGAFVDHFGLDGADLDWEFPVVANQEQGISADSSDANNFVELLKVVRATIPSPKEVSISVPCRDSDMLAYTAATVPALDASVDWWNLMTYDFINRYDNVTGYHAGGVVVDRTVEIYHGLGLDYMKMVVGFPMYAKWFTMATPCTADPPIGCSMGPFEANGVILQASGTWVTSTYAGINWITDTTVAARVNSSFTALPTTGTDNTTALASAWYDPSNSLFWTWLTPSDIRQTCAKYKNKVGGVSVWSLNQDDGNSSGGIHITALKDCVKGL